MSDIIGILKAHSDKGNPLTLEQIKKAVTELYGEWSALPQSSIDFIEQIMRSENYGEIFEKTKKSEAENKATLQSFETNYPGVLTEENLDEVLRRASKETDEKNEDEIDEQSDYPTPTM